MDADKSGCYYVTQYLPIDNDQSDDKDLIVLSIVATDADGDSVEADVDVILKDGVETKLTDSSLTYQEVNDEFGAAKTGTVDLKQGSDGVSEISVSLDNDTDVMSWTSQDRPLDLVNSGNDYTLVYEDDPDSKVLEFIFDEQSGAYQVIQYQPIDQDSMNQSKLHLR
ncbi:hypothetical protein JCM19238_1738 [Vibrio ponticus]|nr:hypothetical protein JCM19238_1738 [Vibrio ponticus]